MDNRMTVAQLIEHLKTLPQDYEVWSLDDIHGDAVCAPVIQQSILVAHTSKKVEIYGDACER